MSNTVSALVKPRKVGSPTAKAVLMYLADVASDDGSGIWVSKSTMADHLEMGRRTVQMAIGSLIEMGVVAEVGKRQCRHGFTVEYRIELTAVEALPDTRAGAAPVQDVHPTRAGAAPLPVQELHINHPRNHPRTTPKRARATSKKVSFTEDWRPSEAVIAWALGLGLSEKQIESEIERCRSYYVGKGERFAELDPIWKAWCINSRDKSRTQSKRSDHESSDSTNFKEIAARMRRLSAGGVNA